MSSTTSEELPRAGQTRLGSPDLLRWRNRRRYMRLRGRARRGRGGEYVPARRVTVASASGRPWSAWRIPANSKRTYRCCCRAGGTRLGFCVMGANGARLAAASADKVDRRHCEACRRQQGPERRSRNSSVPSARRRRDASAGHKRNPGGRRRNLLLEDLERTTVEPEDTHVLHVASRWRSPRSTSAVTKNKGVRATGAG